MAYTKIIVIRGRLDKCLSYAANEGKTYLETAVDYALDRGKTERVCFETAINCGRDTAYQDMMQTARRWGKQNCVRKGYHAKMSKQIGASVEKASRHREAVSRCSTTDVRVSPCWGSVSRRTTPVKAGRLPCGSRPRAAQRERWAGLDRSRAAAYKAYKGETLTIRAERG